MPRNPAHTWILIGAVLAAMLAIFLVLLVYRHNHSIDPVKTPMNPRSGLNGPRLPEANG